MSRTSKSQNAEAAKFQAVKSAVRTISAKSARPASILQRTRASAIAVCVFCSLCVWDCWSVFIDVYIVVHLAQKAAHRQHQSLEARNHATAAYDLARSHNATTPLVPAIDQSVHSEVRGWPHCWWSSIVDVLQLSGLCPRLVRCCITLLAVVCHCLQLTNAQRRQSVRSQRRHLLHLPCHAGSSPEAFNESWKADLHCHTVRIYNHCDFPLCCLAAPSKDSSGHR